MQPQILETRCETANRVEQKKLFETEFSEWIVAQNAYVEARGIPSSDMRPW